MTLKSVIDYINTAVAHLVAQAYDSQLARFLAALMAYFTIEMLTDFGKVCAALLSIAMFGEWIYKRTIRPWLQRRRKARGLELDPDTVKGDL